MRKSFLNQTVNNLIKISIFGTENFDILKCIIDASLTFHPLINIDQHQLILRLLNGVIKVMIMEIYNIIQMSPRMGF